MQSPPSKHGESNEKADETIIEPKNPSFLSTLDVLRRAATKRLESQETADSPNLVAGVKGVVHVGKKHSKCKMPAELKKDILVEDTGWVLHLGRKASMQTKHMLAHFATSLESIPTAEKYSYLLALQNCPELLGVESDPLQFIRFERNNYVAAARRFVLFWERRCHLFNERSFLPMNTTGSGILSPPDLVGYESGSTRILPPDRRGRPVLYLNPSLAVVGNKETSRVDFYFKWLLMCNPVTALEGYQQIIVLDSDALKNCYEQLARSQQMTDAAPVNCLHTHFILKCTDMNDERYYHHRFYPLVVSLFHSSVSTHPGWPGEATYRSLQSHGFERESLPSDISGLAETKEIQNQKKATSETPRITTTSISSNRSDDFGNGDDPATVDEQAELERKRRMNAAASRNKRARRRDREVWFLVKRDELMHENASLKVEYGRLTELLAEAHRFVECFNNDMAMAQQIMYSQRIANPLLQGNDLRQDIVNRVFGEHEEWRQQSESNQDARSLRKNQGSS